MSYYVKIIRLFIKKQNNVNRNFLKAIKRTYFNLLRFFYFKHNNDHYFPLQEKSTYSFDPEPEKHFHLCVLNTNYEIYNFNLKINYDFNC